MILRYIYLFYNWRIYNEINFCSCFYFFLNKCYEFINLFANNIIISCIWIIFQAWYFSYSIKFLPVCIKLISFPSLQVSFLYFGSIWHMLLRVCESSICLWSIISLKISIESTEIEMPESTREQNVLEHSLLRTPWFILNEYFEMKLAINCWKCMIILSTNRELLLLLLLKQYRNFIETTIC